MNQAYRLGAWSLIVGVAGIRLLYLATICPLDLAPDEAYYWEWARHLDFSYHSKGPLVAWLIRVSCEIFGDTMIAVRFPAVVCGSLLLAGLYVLTVQVYQSDKLAFAVTALALTLPIVGAGSTLMTIDAPFTCAWTWALVFGFHAVFRGVNWPWPAAGICLMLGVLAKHTMVLWVPSFALFLLMTPSLRIHLAKVGFWIMVGLGCLGGVPILLWNAMHGWVMLDHTRSHAGLEDNDSIHWLGPLRYLGSQFAVVLGIWFIAWGRAIWHHRPTAELQPEMRFLWWMSAPVFIFFGVFSVANGGGEANWPLAAYLSGMVLAAGWMANKWQHPVTWHRRFCKISTVTAAALGLAVTLLVHEPTMMQPVLLRLSGPATEQQPTPIRRIDPTARLRGWRHLAAEVDRVRNDLQSRGIEPVLAAERWTQASEMGFYCQGRPAFVVLGIPLGDRICQYDLWRPNPINDPGDYYGQPFLIVGVGLDRLRPAFDSFEASRSITYCENGCPITEWTIVVAHGFRGWKNLEEPRKD